MRFCDCSTLTLTVDVFMRLPSPFHMYTWVACSLAGNFHKDFNANHTIGGTHEGGRYSPNQTNPCLFTMRSCGYSTFTLMVDASTRLPNLFYVHGWVFWCLGPTIHMGINANHTIDCAEEELNSAQGKTNPCLSTMRSCGHSSFTLVELMHPQCCQILFTCLNELFDAYSQLCICGLWPSTLLTVLKRV